MFSRFYEAMGKGVGRSAVARNSRSFDAGPPDSQQSESEEPRGRLDQDDNFIGWPIRGAEAPLYHRPSLAQLPQRLLTDYRSDRR